MLILSIHGGTEAPHEDLKIFDPGKITHDAAAVLVQDGVVVAAIEEERLNRVKHTGKSPLEAINFCLDKLGVTYAEIDKLVMTTREQECDLIIRDDFFYRESTAKNTRDFLAEMIYKQTGARFDREKVHFIDHHICHAASAHYMSGFDRSLTVTIDGASKEGFAGYVISAEGAEFQVLDRITNDNSLGAFYTSVIHVLGYHPHDEYKVMGLAPYGDASKFRRLLRRAYTLLPEGKYVTNPTWTTAL